MIDKGKWSDRSRIEQLQRGDRALLEELYHDLSPVLFSAVARLIEPPAAQEIVFEQVFVEFFRRLPDYKPDTQTLLSWMLGICQRHIYEWHCNQ